jgi:hypothetical protein
MTAAGVKDSGGGGGQRWRITMRLDNNGGNGQ